jgi:hypothetical protein
MEAAMSATVTGPGYSRLRAVGKRDVDHVKSGEQKQKSAGQPRFELLDVGFLARLGFEACEQCVLDHAHLLS